MEFEGSEARVERIVHESPGASTREIAVLSGLSESSASYHLKRLHRRGVLVRDEHGRHVAWFTRGHGLCPVLRRASPLGRDADARAVLVALDPLTPRTAAALARDAGISWGATRWTLDALEGAHLVTRGPSGRCMLAAGAETCRAKLLAGERCDAWGACELSRALRERDEATSR